MQVGRWRTRYANGGLAAIQKDLPRGGRPVKVDAAQTLPTAGTHWSTRSLAAKVGVSDTTVLRVWRQHGLKPHRVRTFKVSRDRTQPGLPLKKGRAATMTHDYKRNGTTTLFAALNVLDGQVIAQCRQRHRLIEWLKFLRQIERETPEDKELHLIADNYATHKHPAVQKWLAKRPRFHMHFCVGRIHKRA